MEKITKFTESLGKWLRKNIKPQIRDTLTFVGIVLLLLSLLLSLFNASHGLINVLLFSSTVILLPRLFVAMYDSTIVDKS